RELRHRRHGRGASLGRVAGGVPRVQEPRLEERPRGALDWRSHRAGPGGVGGVAGRALREVDGPTPRGRGVAGALAAAGQRERHQRGQGPPHRSSARLAFVSSPSRARARALGWSTISQTAAVRKARRARSGKEKRTKWTALIFPRSSSEWPTSNSPTLTSSPTCKRT